MSGDDLSEPMSDSVTMSSKSVCMSNFLSVVIKMSFSFAVAIEVLTPFSLSLFK